MNSKLLKKDIQEIRERVREIKYRLGFLSTSNKFENDERKLLLGELQFLKSDLKSTLVKRPQLSILQT